MKTLLSHHTSDLLYIELYRHDATSEHEMMILEKVPNITTVVLFDNPQLIKPLVKAALTNGLVYRPQNFTQEIQGNDGRLTHLPSGEQSQWLPTDTLKDTLACTCLGTGLGTFMLGVPSDEVPA